MESEQEQLAKLIGGNGEGEVIDSASMIADSLRSKIGSPDANSMNKVMDEITSAGDIAVKGQGSSMPTVGLPNGASTEAVLLDLLDLRTGLIAAFEGCKINTKTSQRISTAISIGERLISGVGGSIEEFVPLQHVSGLKPPDFFKNAKKVIETTKSCYSLGEVSDCKISDDGTKIDVRFYGKEVDTYFLVTGSVMAEEWTGSEALDYVYTPGVGKLSVKVFEDGRWIDKSDSGRYDVSWDLMESSKEIDLSEEKVVVEEGITATATNNLAEEDIDIGDEIT